jgi:hypothetical protein
MQVKILHVVHQISIHPLFYPIQIHFIDLPELLFEPFSETLQCSPTPFNRLPTAMLNQAAIPPGAPPKFS